MGFSSLEWQRAPVGSPLAFILSIECRETTSKSYILSATTMATTWIFCLTFYVFPGRPIQTHKDTVTDFQFQLNHSSNWTWSNGGYFHSLKSYSSSYSGTLSLSQQEKAWTFFGLSIKAKVQLFTHTHAQTVVNLIMECFKGLFVQKSMNMSMNCSRL